MGDEIEVRNNPSQLRYELHLDGKPAGMIVYSRQPDAVSLVHTEVEPQLQGRGLGGRLVAGALADIRARGLHVDPICPFVRSYIDRHPEYRDLVVTDSELPD
ncbi:MAG: N-acetyltransferase [Actinomycetota bacterium]|nr:N-acetyltransferase [Actinomycetota bacterium]